MARILVIDDEESMLAIMVRLLSIAGHDVESARDGTSGLSLLKQKDFHLVVTDLIMPGREGIETIIEIRKHNRTIPIIAISGGGKVGSNEYLPMALGIGADYAFPKPIDKEPFLAAVEECLSLRQL